MAHTDNSRTFKGVLSCCLPAMIFLVGTSVAYFSLESKPQTSLPQYDTSDKIVVIEPAQEHI